MVDDKAAKHLEIINKAQTDPSIPKLYANGFALGVTNADILVALTLGGQVVATLNLSYTLSKTLGQKLGGAVAQLEAATQTTFVTTDKIDSAVKNRPPDKKSKSKNQETKH